MLKQLRSFAYACKERDKELEITNRNIKKITKKHTPFKFAVQDSFRDGTQRLLVDAWILALLEAVDLHVDVVVFT